jgi:O-acetyl-ADP-ribose deacetylase (regulator of RNase III)
MLEFKHGNLLHENVEALVNAVNCVGVMGKGIALEFKNSFPENFRLYKKACKAGEVHPGKMFVVFAIGLLNPKYIINFPTKFHWENKSRIKDIESGLDALALEIQKLGINSIAIPALGCGNGGLDWSDVKPLIESKLSQPQMQNVKVIIFEP